MDLCTFLLSAILGIFVIFIVKRFQFLSKLPPGPWGLPVIGQQIHLVKNNAIIEFKKWRAIYGDIFCYSIGDFYVIVLNDYKTIIDLLKKDEFQGRPDFQSWKERNFGVKNQGILFSDGVHSWSEQRRFSLRTLRDFGFGKESMEGLLQSEIQQLVKRFKKDAANKKPIEMKTALNASVFNSLWYIVSGERFELDDPIFHKLLSKTQGHISNLSFSSPGNFYPWPAKMNLIRRGAWKKMMDMYKDVLELMDSIIQNHLDTYDENQTRDYIDTYLHAKNKLKDEAASSFNEKQWRTSLKTVLNDLFAAGTETTSTTLLWAILYMSKYPEIQSKLHKEIDLVIGKGRPPSRTDKPHLCYVEAFTNEVHRKCSLIPMSVYHKMQEDYEYKGYLFPKGAVVFPNIYQAHHDVEFWGDDAECFRPERFLDASGKLLPKLEAFMPFSTGKRACLGEPLAKDTLFIFLVGMLQNFSFELDASSQDYDFMSEHKPNFVVSPDPFQVILHQR